MTHDEAQDLIPPYQLKILESELVAPLEEHLLACPDCAQAATEIRAVVECLPFAAPPVTPADSCLERLMRNLGLTEVSVSTVDRTSWRSASRRLTDASRTRRQWWPRRPSWGLGTAIAVCASLLAAIGLAGWNVLLMGQVQADRNSIGTLTARLGRQSQLLVMMTSAGMTFHPLAPTSMAPNAEVRLIMDADDHAMILASHLPQLGSDQIYEVWLGHAGSRVPAGALRVDQLGNGECSLSAPNPVHQYDSAWITIEPARGSPSSSSPGVASGKL